MRYKPLFIALFLAASLAVAFGFSQKARQVFFHATDGIKSQYTQFKEALGKTYGRFFDQARTIAYYQDKYSQYQRVELELIELKERLNKILEFYPQLDLYPSAVFEPALVLSYVELSAYDKVWLRTKEQYAQDKIFGIVRDGYALGIAVFEQGRLLGLFNGNEKCSYSVYIGASKIPALLHYDPKDSQNVIADFIPQYLSIQEGDEVFTSGLDDIFIENIPVGRVEKIIDQNGYISAVIKPYADKKAPEYLWIINKEKPHAK